jgi:hypothetical protein
MKRPIALGKVDYTGNGRADCPVTIEIELREHGPEYTTTGEPIYKQTTDHRQVTTYTELSVCGDIWQANRRDTYSCGQNIEEIAELFPDRPDVQRIADIWRAWHLNGMTAGCIHQGDAWTCTHHPSEHDQTIARLRAELDDLYEQRAEPKEISAAAYRIKWAAEVQALAHDEPVINGWDIARRMQADHQTPPPNISTVGGFPMTNKAYGFRGDSCVVCGRARWDEPTDACSETGYRYGSSWLVRSLPPEIEQEVRQIIGSPK